MVEWRDIPTAPAYEVSSDGRVRRKAYELKPYPIPDGHLYVTVAGRREYVHRIIAEAFLPPDPARPWINHKDGNPGNNQVSNLERCTPGENIAHGYRENGRIAWQSKPVMAHDLDGTYVGTWLSASDAARDLAVSRGAILSSIRRGGTCLDCRWAFV